MQESKLAEYTAQGICLPPVVKHAKVRAAIGSSSQYGLSFQNPFPGPATIKVSSELDHGWEMDKKATDETWLEAFEFVELRFIFRPTTNHAARRTAALCILCSYPAGNEAVEFPYRITGKVDDIQPLHQCVLQTQPGTRIQQAFPLTIPRHMTFNGAHPFHLKQHGNTTIGIGDITTQVCSIHVIVFLWQSPANCARWNRDKKKFNHC